MATLLAEAFPALSEVDACEAEFLGHLIRDLIMEATSDGAARLRFHEYELAAWCNPLGALLVAVTWRLSKHGVPLARDTAIRYAARRAA